MAATFYQYSKDNWVVDVVVAGSFSNDDDDDNVKNKLFCKQDNSFARASHFFGNTLLVFEEHLRLTKHPFMSWNCRETDKCFENGKFT